MCNSMSYRKFLCLGCGYLYDEALGDPDAGIMPGTKWEDLPNEWVCPDCGTVKSKFKMIEYGE